MDLGRIPTRFDRWRQAPAVVVLAALLALLLVAAWPGAPSAAPAGRASVTAQSDPDLYRAIIARVAAGEAYYPVAADELRRGGYPLRPFVTFRLPTLAVVSAHLPAFALPIGQGLLLLAVLVVWWRRLASDLPLTLLAAALVLLVAGSAALIGPVTSLFHESWTALLLALMVGLRRPGHALPAMIAGALALTVRETALPMILAMAALALGERRWKEGFGWTALVLLFVVAMAGHAHLVASVVRPDDLASPGWSGLLGARFAASAIASVTSAAVLPAGLAAALLILSLFGWFAVASQWALRVAVLLLGYGAMLALFARPDTFYWALLAAPLSLVGLAFVPRALTALVRASRGVAQRTA